MNLYAGLLGTPTVTRLQEIDRASVLQVGSDTLTRAELGRVRCWNFLAARNLSTILHEHLKVPNLRHVFENVPPSALALPRMGSISLAVLGAAFEAKGIGGATPLENYVKKHQVSNNGHSSAVTFYTLKHRDQLENSRERKDRKRRKSQRRDEAQKIRVQRFSKPHLG